MPGRQSKYAWPASRLSDEDMYMLYLARQQSAERTPISRLLAQAVRETFGHFAENINEPIEERKAA